jgi:hypothetical protein
MSLYDAVGPLHAYLQGTGRDGRGRAMDDVLAFSDDALEHIHDYIQWLFPLPTKSMAQPSAPVLTSEETSAIRSDRRALTNLQRAADCMLGFYRRTDQWLSWSDHNHLRISRIIQSLNILAGESAAREFYTGIMARCLAAGSPVNPGNIDYWRRALRR